MLRETDSRRRAVLATAGQVLTYKGQLASTMYCGDCGGATECYTDAHGDNVPYLVTVTEPAGVACRTWQKSYNLTELAAALVAAGFDEADGLQSVAITKTSSSGRALLIEFTGSTGTVDIDAAKLRSVLGSDIICSTLFTVQTTPDGMVTFNGKGSGHGFGLSQVGAKALAGPPFNYTFDRILAHYYPGTTLTGSVVSKPDPPKKSTPKLPKHQRGRKSSASHRIGSSSVSIRVVEPRL
jgi:stage II sporulation protein D